MFSLCVQEGVLSGIKGMNLAGLRMPHLSSGTLIQVPVLSSQVVSLAVAPGVCPPHGPFSAAPLGAVATPPGASGLGFP